MTGRAAQERPAVVLQPGTFVQIVAEQADDVAWFAVYRVMQPIDLDRDAAQFRARYDYPEQYTTPRTELHHLRDWRNDWVNSLTSRSVLVQIETVDISYYQYADRSSEDWDLSIHYPSEQADAE